MFVKGEYVRVEGYKIYAERVRVRERERERRE